MQNSFKMNDCEYTVELINSVRETLSDSFNRV